MKRRHSIRMKVVVFPLVLVFLAVLLLSVISNYTAYTSTIEQKRLGGLAVAQQIRKRLVENAKALRALEGLLEETSRSTADLVQVPGGEAGDPHLADVAQRLVEVHVNQVQALQEEYSSQQLVVDATSGATLSYAYVFNPQGELEAASRVVEPGRLLQDEAKRSALEKRSNYLSLTNDPLTGELVWDIMLPAFVDEEYAGAVNVGVNLEIVSRTMRTSIALTVAVAGATYVVLALTLTLTASRLVRSIEGVGRHINLIGGKVLHQQVPGALQGRQDEVGLIARGIQAMQDALSSVLTRVHEAAAATAQASQELSASTNQASASIEEVAGTANQFASTVQSMGSNVADMVRAAEGIHKSASEGQEVVGRAVALADQLSDDMAELSQAVARFGERSREIGQIVEVITAIADQTNLLALNAAIEAARAGEYGRGFAVVAEEVRELAEEAAASSKQITELVRAIQGETEHTVAGIKRTAADAEASAGAVARSGELMSSILEQIGSITGTIREVSKGLELINAGSEELAAATEEQSASMANIASAAQELSLMSERLQELVREFELNEQDTQGES